MSTYYKVGDIIKLDISPGFGHEQLGYRPALVISEENVHIQTDLIWILPITSSDKGFPTHIPVRKRTANSNTPDGVDGFVLCEQVKAIDPQARKVKLVDQANRELIEECKAIIDAITYID